MNKQKIMALLLTTLISINQVTTIANATTNDVNNEVFVTENETNEVTAEDPSEDIIVEDSVDVAEDATIETPAELPSDTTVVDTEDVTPEEDNATASTVVPMEAWDNHINLIAQVLSKLGLADLYSMNSDAEIIAAIEENLPKVTYEALKEIKMIDLSGSKQALPAIVSKFTGLVNLNLYSALPDNANVNETFEIISSLTNLKDLDISYNNLSTIPTSISNLKGLEILFAQGNKFSEIPTSVLSLTNLQYLDLAYCDILSIPSDINKLTSLLSLELLANNISNLPSSMSNMGSLRHLGLSQNNFTEVPMVALQLPKLEELLLASNEIISIPNEVINMTGDTLPFTLDISFNQVYKLPETTTQNIIYDYTFIESSTSLSLTLQFYNPNGGQISLPVEDLINSSNYTDKVLVSVVVEDEYGFIDLDSRIPLDILIDGKLYTKSDLKTLAKGTYNAKFKISDSELENINTQTDDSFNLIVSTDSTPSVPVNPEPPVDPSKPTPPPTTTKPSTGSGTSTTPTLPKTGDASSVGFLMTGILSLAGGAGLFAKKSKRK